MTVCCKISDTLLQLSLPPLSYLVKTQAQSSTTLHTTYMTSFGRPC